MVDDKHCPKEHCPFSEELSALQAELKTLRAQVIHDHLTGLFNARQLENSLSQEMERTLRSRQPTTLIIIDIDFFKKVNDSYGHAAGDIVLKKVAQTLKKSTRMLDTCCRYGGEEFVVILPSTHLLIGVQVAERIRKTLEETPIELTEGEIHITASFGVACFHYNSRLNQTDFFKLADKQLYRAKKNGRNQVCHAAHQESSSPSVSMEERAALFTGDQESDDQAGEEDQSNS